LLVNPPAYKANSQHLDKFALKIKESIRGRDMPKIVLDDGASRAEVDVETVINALKKAGSKYNNCISNGKSRNICYVEAINELFNAFGSAMINVFYDEDFRYFAVKSADYNWLLYDAQLNKYKLIRFRDLVAMTV